MARVLSQAPPRVKLCLADDGWAAACLRIAGRVPVWGGYGEQRRPAATLARLGLPGLETGEADGELRSNLTLRTSAPPGAAPLPAATGPRVSILICTYNRKDLVVQSIASALAQTWPREVLVIDDASTDGTWEVLRGIEGIQAIRQPRNGGKARALNAGLAAATGQAVMVLDDDDLLLPGALHVLARSLFVHDRLAAVYSDTIYFDGATGEVRRYFPCSRAPGSMALRVALQQIPCTTGATLVRMSAQREAGEYDTDLVRGEDMDMFLRLAHVGPIEGLPLPTFLARSHDGLRGTSAGQWRKTDRDEEDERALRFIRPVFRRRWQALAPGTDRAESHAWALGLGLRGLMGEARQELSRWQPPFSATEAWVRQQAKEAAEPAPTSGAFVVVDDGDPGSLELVLARCEPDLEVWVNLEVPRDPLGSLQLHWPGHYGAQERLASWVQHPGPWHLRTSSDPYWQPPPLHDPRLLPDVTGPDALLALSAVMGWAPPRRTRVGATRIRHPLAVAAMKARRCLGRGNPQGALGFIGNVLAQQATWRGGWVLAEQAFTGLGRADQAAFCRGRAEAA